MYVFVASEIHFILAKMVAHLQIMFLLYTFVLPVDLIDPVIALVDRCPKIEQDVIQASKRLGCGNDIYGNNQYLCLPNRNKTSLVEFCYQGSMGIIEKGKCLEFSEGELIRHSCNHFLYGCPEAHFFDYDIYKYPACQNISTELQCYVLDPSCTVHSNTKESSSQNIVIIIFSIVGCLFFIICCIIMICCYKRRRIHRNEDSWCPFSFDVNEMETMLESSETGDQKEESKEHTHCNKRKSNQKNGVMESQQNNGTGGTLQRSMGTVIKELTKKQNEKDKT